MPKSKYQEKKNWYKVITSWSTTHEELTSSGAEKYRRMGYKVLLAPGYTPPEQPEQPEPTQLNLFGEKKNEHE